MKLELNKHLKKLLYNKICPIHNKKIKFLEEKNNGDTTTATLSFCCDEFKDSIEGEGKTKIFEEASLEAAKEEVQKMLNEIFKK